MPGIDLYSPKGFKWYLAIRWTLIILTVLLVVVIGLAVASFRDRPLNADFYRLSTGNYDDGTQVNLPGRAYQTTGNGQRFLIKGIENTSNTIWVCVPGKLPVDGQRILVRGVFRDLDPGGYYIEATGWRPLGDGWWIGLRRWFIDLPF